MKIKHEIIGCEDKIMVENPELRTIVGELFTIIKEEVKDKTKQKRARYILANYICTDKYDNYLLSAEERAIALTAINKILTQEEINLEVAGYEDNDGVYFNVILMRKGE